MSVDKAFLRNVSIQTGPGREELKALKDCPESSPGFMEQLVLLLQGPALSNIPVPPASRGAAEENPSQQQEGRCRSEGEAEEGKLKGWLADVLSTGITECMTAVGLHTGMQRRPESCTATVSLEDALSGTPEEREEI